MTPFDAVGFGALNVDQLFKVNKIAGAEEESYVKNSRETCGGSAANTMVGLARLGCKVGFIGKVAEDREGRMLMEAFNREGVDTAGVAVSQQGRTGTVMGFIDDKGERALYVNGGVNNTLELADIPPGYASGSAFLHLTSFAGERSFQTQKEYLQTLPAEVKLTLDPGTLYAERKADLNPILNRTSVLMPNQKELQMLTGETDYQRGAEDILKQGVKTVAVKLGRKGCYVTDGEESHLVEGFEVKVVDTTGAGDAFCAGFLYSLISGKNLYQCGRMGNFVASRCTTEMGARNGLPYLEDIQNKKLA